ncbi:MAG: cytochrome c oxidase subunit II [Acidobacteria bacterium]|nr:cytochrome c oxidase subunit II [Acidobacteriota bacterium]
MSGAFQLLPQQASDVAPRVDHLFFALVALALFITALVAALIVVFSVRYRRGSPADRSNPPHGNNALEIAWIGGPLIVVMGLFWWGARTYVELYADRPAPLEIHVVGKQWMWKFQHPEGHREIDELHLPLGTEVRLVLTSQDVIHSLFVPAFRVKRDAVPGRYTSVAFTPTRPGRFPLFCAEYCGTEHSLMRGAVVVLEPARYEQWLAGTPPDTTPAASGEDLFLGRRCAFCHRDDGSGVGPSLVGVAGSRVRLTSGLSVTADENYLRDSILVPNSQVVDGYPNVMPTFQGQLSEQELYQLIAYIQSLQPGRRPPPRHPGEPREPVPGRAAAELPR